MKKLTLLLFTTVLLFGPAAHGQNACGIVISGDFSSQCLYDVKGTPFNEQASTVLVACRHSQVTYTANIVPSTLNGETYVWSVVGGEIQSATGNQLVVDWGDDTRGVLVVTVTLADSSQCSAYADVQLIAAPEAASSSVPAYTVNAAGEKVIRVCRHSRLEFLDRSADGGSDIAGHMWQCNIAASSATPNYVIETVDEECKVYHRVTNNCGCYDEEIYYIEVVDGVQLDISCIGTVCEGSVVTYDAGNTPCGEYFWHADGGTVTKGQYSPYPTVQWDRPHDGYGVLSLDGALCGDEVCPTLMSVRVPVIQDSLAIVGPQSVCLGESAVYRLPLFGSTRYDWSVHSPNPASPATITADMPNSHEVRLTFPEAGTYHLHATYRCGFLDCGPCHAQDFVIEVQPVLTIHGQDQICSSNSCSLSVQPAVTAVWHVYDLGAGNQEVGTPASGSVFSQTLPTGRYLVTAEHPSHCGPATFVLTVKDPPPAPTLANFDPDNPTVACPNGGVRLRGTPAEAHYNLVWTVAPSCTTATPALQSGDEAVISYNGCVGDVHVYHYDRLLQCQSVNAYVHTMVPLTPAPHSLPTNITVCPNTIIQWTHGEVPDQSADGMLYEWKIDSLQQNCASVLGSHQQPGVTLAINDMHSTTPDTFYVELRRYYCNSNSNSNNIALHRIYITVRTDLSVAPVISGPTDVCLDDVDTFTANGVPTGHYSWRAQDAVFEGNPFVFHFDRSSSPVEVELTCSPYNYCTNSAYYSRVSTFVTVHQPPVLREIVYDESTNTLSVVPDFCGMQGYSFAWTYTPATGPAPIPLHVSNDCTIYPSVGGYYDCRVTNAHGCSSIVGYVFPSLPNTDTMTLSVLSTNYCTGTIQLSAPVYSRNVSWLCPGGSIATSGYHNRYANITFPHVGTYSVTATTSLGPLVSQITGRARVTLDFIPRFDFVPACNKVEILNRSEYIDQWQTVRLTVVNSCNSDVDTLTFPVSQTSYTYYPSTTPSAPCTYTFYLTRYGSVSISSPGCLLDSVTIGMQAATVSIATENPYDTTATCDNTPLRLTASLSNQGTITATEWSFGDGSTYSDSGPTVYHTFHTSTIPYTLTATVTDNHGCTFNSVPLTIRSIADNIATGSLLQSGQSSCPYQTSSLRQIGFAPTSTSSPYNHYTWASPLTGNLSYNLVNEPDNYSVSVANDNFCHKEGLTYVSFLPCPTARIYADNLGCCVGQPITLNGSLAPEASIVYAWTVSGPSFAQTYSTPSITFTPVAAGAHTVTLKVTNAAGCSDSTTVTVAAAAPPAPPTLVFSGSTPCISHAPVEIAASNYSGQVHWSNGDTGPVAHYYAPGVATAYYFDPAAGCPSQEASIHIHHQPDFDALLTGCYEKCKSYFWNNPLPVYGLTPDTFAYGWFQDGYTVQSAAPAAMPLGLPLPGPGDFRLHVDYQNSACDTLSPLLSIRKKDTCDCEDIDIMLADISVTTEECLLLAYDVTLKVCNHSGIDFCLDQVEVVSDVNSVLGVVCAPVVVADGDCQTVHLSLHVSGLIPANVLLRIYSECGGCTKLFSLRLADVVDCMNPEALLGIEPYLELTNEEVAYCKYVLTLPAECSLLGLWSDPAMILDYNYTPGSGEASGLCMLDRAVLSQLAEADGKVCFHAILCCNNRLCDYYACMSADELMEMLPDNMQRRVSDSVRSARPATGYDMADNPVLAGNPAGESVTITGTPCEVVELLVMDMHGRLVARHEATRTLDVAHLAAGSYIVRIATLAPDGVRRVHYRKLIKR